MTSYPTLLAVGLYLFFIFFRRILAFPNPRLALFRQSLHASCPLNGLAVTGDPTNAQVIPGSPLPLPLPSANGRLVRVSSSVCANRLLLTSTFFLLRSRFSYFFLQFLVNEARCFAFDLTFGRARFYFPQNSPPVGSLIVTILLGGVCKACFFFLYSLLIRCTNTYHAFILSYRHYCHRSSSSM